MDQALIRQRSAAARVARLATVTPDGRPHIVPCCFAVDGDCAFTAVDDIKAKTTRDLRRLRNLLAHPAVSLLIDHYVEDWSALWWIRMDGRAHLAEHGSTEHIHAQEVLASKYDQYRRRPPPGAVVVVEIDTWRAWP